MQSVLREFLRTTDAVARMPIAGSSFGDVERCRYKSMKTVYPLDTPSNRRNREEELLEARNCDSRITEGCQRSIRGTRVMGAGDTSLCRSIGLLGWLLMIPGCSGCGADRDSTDVNDKEQEVQEAFSSGELRMLPTDDNLSAYGIKPGHWYAFRQELKANKVDFSGELTGFAGFQQRQPARLARAPFQLATRRPVMLPKGQSKHFELTFFVPHTTANARQVWLYSDLRSGYQGRLQHAQAQVVNRMRAYQHFLVVLSKQPDGFGYIKTMESVKPPDDSIASLSPIRGDYIPVLPPADAKQPPLPSWALMWTNIAYLIWDDYDPKQLTLDQQRALVDWLHWGGQLIVSGPRSLATLRGSFLHDYLPADAGSRAPMDPRTVDELNRHWAIPVPARNRDGKLSLRAAQAAEVVELIPRDDSQFTERSGELIVERKVGRGRVAATAFSLSSRALLNWSSLDNFFNGCLLRRPGRRYELGPEGFLQAEWVTGALRDVTARTSVSVGALRRGTSSRSGRLSVDGDANASGQRFLGPGAGRPSHEALLMSRLRYFTRDAVTTTRPSDAISAGPDESGPSSGEGVRAELDQRRRQPHGFDTAGFQPDQNAGIGAWSDFSQASQIARQALERSAGIEVPDRSFVLIALGGYLMLLVPLNWSVFRVVGKTEWAWAMVPIMAAAGTVVVVKLAQLDIGFARSRTEMAIVEMQTDYPRVHVTRYAGLYTSLSTDYELRFADESAVVLPFSTGMSDDESRSRTTREVFYQRADRKDGNVVLGGLAVSSNSTGMIHAEHMLDLKGAFQLERSAGGISRVVNRTPYQLLDCGVVRRHRGQLQYAHVGPISEGNSLTLSFRDVPDGTPAWKQWNRFGPRRRNWDNVFDMQPWLVLAADGKRLEEGDAVLVGWTDTQMPGLTVEPAASQEKFRTLWVIHLDYGDWATPQSDRNSPKQFTAEAGLLDEVDDD